MIPKQIQINAEWRKEPHSSRFSHKESKVFDVSTPLSVILKWLWSHEGLLDVELKAVD